MRSTEERVGAVVRRVREIEEQRQIRCSRNNIISSVAASLIIVVGLSWMMPGIMANQPRDLYRYSGMAASIFDGRSSLGYIFIGLLAFTLGVGVTILAYLVRIKNQRKDESGEERDG